MATAHECIAPSTRRGGIGAVVYVCVSTSRAVTMRRSFAGPSSLNLLRLLNGSAAVLEALSVGDLEPHRAAVGHRAVAEAPDGFRRLVDEVVLGDLVGPAGIRRVLELPHLHL